MKFIDKVNLRELREGVACKYDAASDKMVNTLVKQSAKVNLLARNYDEKLGYERVGSTAVVPLEGTLLKKASWLDAVSGFSSLSDFEIAFNNAESDPTISRILVYVDSPGGTVDGTEEAAQLVSSSSKEVVAAISGLCCSGAYWIASHADAIYALSSTAVIGSIGVYMMHIDQSVSDQQEGLKVTFISAGKYKTMGNVHEPLSETANTRLQALVNEAYDLFTKDVATFRNLDINKSDAWANGNVFRANEALELGLIDGVVPFSTLVD
jgi:signal peptide peptidase SppA